MRTFIKYFICTILSLFIFSGCTNYKKLITDEVVFTDGSSQTGTIMHCDSMNVKIKKADESISILPWTIIDTIQGKKLKTLWLGTNIGYYNVPYFSVFRNESFAAKNIGIQGKIGLATRGVKLYYLDFSTVSGKPYNVTKVGLGFQRYIGTSTYLKTNTFFVGSEFNLMNVKYNNVSQFTLEPFTGYERKLNEHLRLHVKFGLQINVANKNQQKGVNLTVGINFLKKNFKNHYDILNKEHRVTRY